MGANCSGTPSCEVTLVTLFPQTRKLRLRKGSGSTEASHSEMVPWGYLCVCAVGGGGWAQQGRNPGGINLVGAQVVGWGGAGVAGPRVSHCHHHRSCIRSSKQGRAHAVMWRGDRVVWARLSVDGLGACRGWSERLALRMEVEAGLLGNLLADHGQTGAQEKGACLFQARREYTSLSLKCVPFPCGSEAGPTRSPDVWMLPPHHGCKRGRLPRPQL